jgi:hypothetical protein
MILYRAVPATRVRPGEKKCRHEGRRLPGNVPYLVDNLWEYTRPEGRPSRRHAVYASPTPELALQNAIADGLPPSGYVACRLAFHYEPAIMQLTVSDARHHRDIRTLQQLVNRELGERAGAPLADKLALAALFLPGVTRQELADAMAAAPLLDELVRKAAAAVTFWSATPDQVAEDGELFFEIAEDNFYTLDPV